MAGCGGEGILLWAVGGRDNEQGVGGAQCGAAVVEVACCRCGGGGGGRGGASDVAREEVLATCPSATCGTELEGKATFRAANGLHGEGELTEGGGAGSGLVFSFQGGSAISLSEVGGAVY